MALFNKKKLKLIGSEEKPKRATILLVDDEPDNVFTLKEWLEQNNYRVLGAESGRQALGIIKSFQAENQSIEVIISDQRMPEMCGTEFLAKSIELVPNAIRILLTGYSDMSAVVDAINEAHIYRYVTKPADLQLLEQAIENGLEVYRLREESQRLVRFLQNSYEKIQILDQDKLAFLRFLAHEMNTPLNWLGAVQILERDEISEEVAEVLNFVDKGRGRLKNLVNQVLNYFELAGGKIDINRKNWKLASLVNEAYQEVCLSRKDAGIQSTLHCNIHADLQFPVDQSLILECLKYVFDNGLIYGGDEPEIIVNVNIHNGKGTQDGDFVIAITDHGTGVAEENLERMFQPFQLQEIGRHEHGFGLSLPTCQVLVTAMGGSIWAKSAGVGEGTTIYMKLPLPNEAAIQAVN